MSRGSSLPLPSLGVVLLAAGLTGAHCHSGETAGSPSPVTATPAATPAKDAAANAPPPNEGLTEAEAAKLLPGIDTSDLDPKKRSELVELTGDTFCPCAATTLSACLRSGPTCPAAKRFVELSKKLLQAGQPPANVLLRVEAYYGSFADDRRIPLAATGPSKGSDKARVVIVEFSDFQCPACRAAHPALTELVQKHPNDVKWVFRNFPLPQHEHAEAAATAAAYAADKGKFWPVADWYFSHQDQLGEDGFKEAAKAAGLDPAAFLAASTDPKYKARIEADKKDGMAAKLDHTPSIFVNGREFILPSTPEYLSWDMEDELEWMSNGKKWATR